MKRCVAFVLTAVLLLLMLTACEGNKPTQSVRVEDVRAICELAVFECYYNNVAKLTKEPDNIFQIKREMWIEYEGVARIGIDMEKVSLELKGETVIVTIPEAELLGIQVKEGSIKDESYVVSKDGIFKNKITAEDQQKAVNKGQEAMEKQVMENQSLFQMATTRTQKLIESYVRQIGDVLDVDYEIEWNIISA